MPNTITIGREFGSGGREVGRRLAEELGYEYYDKEIITEIAKKTKLSEEYLQDVIEKKPHRLFPITIGQTLAFSDNYSYQQMQDIYDAQVDILKELAEKSNCVIVGRCADVILKDYHPFRIFVYADMDSKIKRCLERNTDKKELPVKMVEKYIKQIDKHRADYYQFYTGLKWGDKANYDLLLNTTNANIKEVTKALAKLFQGEKQWTL